jgi:hypothetical protein
MTVSVPCLSNLSISSLVIGLAAGLAFGLAVGLLAGLMATMLFGLIGWLFSSPIETIKLVEAVNLRTPPREQLQEIIAMPLFASLFMGLLIWWIDGPIAGLINGLIVGLVLGLLEIHKLIQSKEILALLDLRGLTPYMGVKQRANSRSDPAKAAEIMCQPS